MAISRKRLRSFFARTLPIAAVLVVLRASLFLVTDVEQGGGGFSRHYLWVLGAAAIALAVLLVVITLRIINLVLKVKRAEPGARLAARLVRTFLILALPPALLVYAFSIEFLNETVDGWFDVEVEAALSDSLEMGQQFLDARTLEVRNQLVRTRNRIEGTAASDLFGRLLEQVSVNGPTALTVFTDRGRVVATADIRAGAGSTDRPSDFALLQANQGGEYAAAEPAGEGLLKVRALVRLPNPEPGAEDWLLQAIYPLPANFTQLADRIAREYEAYQNAAYLRARLKQSFALILSLVLLLTVLLAILAAINAARRLVSPISKLAEATRAVADGDFERQIEVPGRDELGFLVESFNRMTQQLKQASEETERSRALLQAQREYLQTVLARISAGVIAIDEDNRLVTANNSAGDILRLSEADSAGRSLEELAAAHPAEADFFTGVAEEIARASKTWRREIKLERSGKPLVLVCRGSSLPALDTGGSGHVVIFDDVTVLDQAQREAAWSEVARRLAHEVKNPLTPIQLAAERIRHKLLADLGEKDAQVLDRGTRTIVSQVESLKSLVNAFGDYAQEPKLATRPVDLHDLIRDVAELYATAERPLALNLDLDAGLTAIHADDGRLRQLLHNLVRNAMEASSSDQQAVIQISTANPAGSDQIQLLVRDHGPGFDETILEAPFEPYVTSKPRGTGLGLAICRKIVEEHGGRIQASNHPEGGALIEVTLPLDTEAVAGQSPASALDESSTA